MAGIYLHIPFCKQACHYCNFHFSTSLKYKSEMVAAMVKELALQRDYLNGASVETIYFGGGTPSLLEIEDIEQLLHEIYAHHSVAENAEITLEANPDDLSVTKLKALASTAINRLSIGVQSFAEADLKFMNRAHDAKMAERCIQQAQEQGFTNLTIDLIYGAPTTTHEIWQDNIKKTIDFQVPHISCYGLTVEPNTALHHFVKKGKVPPLQEEKATEQFEQLMTTLEAAGYVHYEISNFGKPNHFARHNSNYWKGVPYLGIGPSAHAYNGKARSWNIANNAQYLKSLNDNILPFEKEWLSPTQRYNEYVMIGLRTIWGCRLSAIAQIDPAFQLHFQTSIQPFIANGNVTTSDEEQYVLTRKGKLLADYIAMTLFKE